MAGGLEHPIGEILEMATAQIVHGKVLFAAPQEPYETKNGLRINVKIKLANDHEIKLWDNPGGPLQELRKGQPVTLIYDGKTYKLAGTAGHDEPESASLGQPIPEDRRAEIAKYIGSMANLYGFCFSEAQRVYKEFKIEAGEETVRCTASSLFISAKDRFNL